MLDIDQCDFRWWKQWEMWIILQWLCIYVEYNRHKRILEMNPFLLPCRWIGCPTMRPVSETPVGVTLEGTVSACVTPSQSMPWRAWKKASALTGGPPSSVVSFFKLSLNRFKRFLLSVYSYGNIDNLLITTSKFAFSLWAESWPQSAGFWNLYFSAN